MNAKKYYFNIARNLLLDFLNIKNNQFKCFSNKELWAKMFAYIKQSSGKCPLVMDPFQVGGIYQFLSNWPSIVNCLRFENGYTACEINIPRLFGSYSSYHQNKKIGKVQQINL